MSRLVLIAHYYNRNEALIASAALDAAGIPNFLENDAQVALQPFHEIALGGYRLMACAEDVEDAVGVLEEAWRKRSFEGERLSQRTFVGLSLLLMVTLGMFMPFRLSKWHDVGK